MRAQRKCRGLSKRAMIGAGSRPIVVMRTFSRRRSRRAATPPLHIRTFAPGLPFTMSEVGGYGEFPAFLPAALPSGRNCLILRYERCTDFPSTDMRSRGNHISSAAKTQISGGMIEKRHCHKPLSSQLVQRPPRLSDSVLVKALADTHGKERA